VKNLYHYITQVARSIFFDNSSNGFTANNVQAAIEEIGASASPGFSFGREGTSSNGVWLRRVGNIETNRTGITISVTNPVITLVAYGTENVDTYSFGIYQHDGNSVNLVLLTTINVVSTRAGTQTISVATTKNKQLAIKVLSGNPNNLGVDLILKGSV